MKKRSSDKISLKETMRLSLKMYKLLWKIYPMVFVTTVLCTVVGSATPYVDIWLSAQLINELSGGRDVKRLLGLVLAILFFTLLAGILNTLILGRIRNCVHANRWRLQQTIYSDKLLDMDFCDVDDQRTHDLFSQVKQNQMWNGWGLPQMHRYLETFLSGFTGLVSAIVLTVGLFAQAVPEDAGWLTVLNNPFVLVLLIAILLGVTFCASSAE